MPHLYLHQRSADSEIEDLEGAEFASLEAAIEEAVASARDLMAARVREGFEPDGWRFQITGEDGTILAVVPFRETISKDGRLEGVKRTWYRIAR